MSKLNEPKDWFAKENRHCGLMVNLATGKPVFGSETEDAELGQCPNPVRHCVRHPNPPPGSNWENVVWYMCSPCYDYHMNYFAGKPDRPVDV